MTIAFHLMGREGFVRGVRVALLTVTLFVFSAAFVSVCLLRHDDVFVRPQFRSVTSVCITYAIYILVFTVTPIFMVVLVGVANCVAFAASTRHRHPVQRLSMRLDR